MQEPGETKCIGNIGEALVMAMLSARGYQVSKGGEGFSYDLILSIPEGDRLSATFVSVKTSRLNWDRGLVGKGGNKRRPGFKFGDCFCTACDWIYCVCLFADGRYAIIEHKHFERGKVNWFFVPLAEAEALVCGGIPALDVAQNLGAAYNPDEFLFDVSAFH
jgi:hypothetical protein